MTGEPLNEAIVQSGVGRRARTKTMLRWVDAGSGAEGWGALDVDRTNSPEMGTCLEQRALELPRRSGAGAIPARRPITYALFRTA